MTLLETHSKQGGTIDVAQQIRRNRIFHSCIIQQFRNSLETKLNYSIRSRSRELCRHCTNAELVTVTNTTDNGLFLKHYRIGKVLDYYTNPSQ